MDGVSYAQEMSNGSSSPPGPKLSSLDHHILDMLTEHQWTTGAIIDEANERARAGDLDVEDYDPTEDSGDEQPIKRHQIYQRLQILDGMGFIEKVHEPTSLFGLVYDPRNGSGDIDE